MFQYLKNTMGIKERAELDNANRIASKMSDIASIAFIKMAENAMIDDVTAGEHMDIFSPWVSGMDYKKGDLRLYGEGEQQKLYRCLQNHTSQETWTPDAASSLWVVTGDPTVEWPEWSQPVGSEDAYRKGAKVTYDGQHYISDVDNNVWVPGVYGWKLVTE